MALEVSEIGIRLRVNGDDEDDDETKDPMPGTCAESLDRQAIVDDCVRRVLQILQRQRER